MVKTISTSTYYQPEAPQVFIAVRRNRVRIQNKGNEQVAYLQNGTEFQLEFYNHSGYTQKAEIFINGKRQNHALVLRPGEHYYLDRFMDKDRKLKFDVYEVDDTPEVKDIIANNGYIEVRFYKEYIYQPIVWHTWSYGNTDTPYPRYHDTYNTCTNENVTIVGAVNATQASLKSRSAKTTKGITPDSAMSNQVYASAANMQMSAAPTIETGRVAQGNQSNQNFVEVQQSFEFYANTTVKYHILPMSQKSNEVETRDLRDYCPSCGRRIKRGWVHCAGCGEKI